jgi:hypothetical protein
LALDSKPRRSHARNNPFQHASPSQDKAAPGLTRERLSVKVGCQKPHGGGTRAEEASEFHLRYLSEVKHDNRFRRQVQILETQCN